MKRRFCSLIAMVLAMVLFLSCVPVSGWAAESVVTVEVNATFMYEEARSMLDLVNSFRTGSDAYYRSKNNKSNVKVRGLKKLQYDYNLEKVAMLRALELAVYFSHTRPNGKAWKTAHSGNATRGENIAYGLGSAEAAFNAFREDDKNYSGQGHRRIMLEKKFTRVGFGCVKVGDVVYWAQEFSSKAAGKASDKFSSKIVDATWKTLKAAKTKITTSAAELVLTEGETIDLPKVVLTSATGARNSLGKTKWSSANGNIAQVNDNRLTAVQTGETEIMITVGDTTLKVKVQVGTASAAANTEMIDEYTVPLGLGENEFFFVDDEDAAFMDIDETLDEDD